MSSSSTNPRLDEDLTAFVVESKSWLPLLVVNLISEIERLEMILAQQDEAMKAVALSISDCEMDTFE